jgi:chromosome segregation ATPase
MESTLYVSIGTLIGMAINLVIGGILKFRKQTQEQNKSLSDEAYVRLNGFIETLKVQIDERKAENDELDRKYDELKKKVFECESERSKETAKREYLETILQLNGIKIPKLEGDKPT